MEFKNTYSKLERFCNSFSSRKRIEILKVLHKEKDLSLNEIADKILTNKQNASLHTFKLLNHGLVAKRKNKTKVEHILTKRGETVLDFIKFMDKKI